MLRTLTLCTQVLNSTTRPRSSRKSVYFCSYFGWTRWYRCTNSTNALRKMLWHRRWSTLILFIRELFLPQLINLLTYGIQKYNHSFTLHSLYSVDTDYEMYTFLILHYARCSQNKSSITLTTPGILGTCFIFK